MGRLKHKPVWFIIIIVLVLSIAYFTQSSITRSNKIALHIETFPTSTQVIIGDIKTKRGTIHLEPGVYEIQASSEGFKEYSETIKIESWTKSLGIMLDPITDEAREMLISHEDDYLRARKVSYDAKDQSDKNFIEKNPIVKKLPYKSLIYSIGYIKDRSDPSGNSIIVTVHASEGYRQAALHKIRELGYDPTDLTINFRDYENPFPL